MDLPGYLTVAKLWERFSGLSDEMFFVTIHDGYQSEIVVPEQLRMVSRDDRQYMQVAQVAQPISCAESIRNDDSVLDALTEMERTVVIASRFWIVTNALLVSSLGKSLAKLVAENPAAPVDMSFGQ